MEFKRSAATKKDLENGRLAEEALFHYWKDIKSPKNITFYWLNEKFDDKSIIDIVGHDTEKDFAHIFQVEGKKRVLFTKVYNGITKNGQDSFKDMNVSLKSFDSLLSDETKKKGLKIIGREFTEQELLSAKYIMIPLDAHVNLDYGFLCDINESFLKHYNQDGSHNRIQKIPCKREDWEYKREEYFFKIPFNEVQLRDYRF